MPIWGWVSFLVVVAGSVAYSGFKCWGRWRELDRRQVLEAARLHGWRVIALVRIPEEKHNPWRLEAEGANGRSFVVNCRVERRGAVRFSRPNSAPPDTTAR